MKGNLEQSRVARSRPVAGGGVCCPAVLLLEIVLGSLVMTGAAGCQAQGPRGQQVEPLKLTDVGGYLEFVARQREQNQESKVGAGTSKYRETILEENLRLETDGYAYHPNLMEFTLGGLFGLLQHDYFEDVGGREHTSSDDGTVLEFDLHAGFFKKKPYPGTIFARRYQAIEPRPFQSSLETITTTFGLFWQYVSEKTPTSFQLSSTEVELKPMNDEEKPGLQKNTTARFETAYRFSDHNVLSFVYNRQSVEEQPFNLKYDSDEATLSHRLNFGDLHRQRLESELNYFDQRGTFDIRRVRWRELLRLEHTDTLRSWYRFELLDRTQGSISGVPPIDERSYYLSGTLEHELYESLVSQFLVYGQRQKFDSGLNIDRFGAQASFDYRKTNPWGLLLANYRARIIREERTGNEFSAEVTDEQHTFRDPEPIVLGNANVDTGSIFITAEDKVTIYQAGRDYTVFVRGDRVEIERVPTGRILDGQIVIIDYVFHVGGNFTLDTLGQDFSIRQNFPFGLSPYYRLRWQDQTITPETATGAVPNDITAHILGTEFRWRTLRLVGEYEDHDSTITPFKAVRLTGDYTHHFKSKATGNLKARWTDISYEPPDERDVTFFTVEGRYRHPVTEHLTLEGSALYRTEDDSLSGKDQGVDVDLSLEWYVRQTEVRVTYELGNFEDDFTKNDYSTLYVQVKRRF
ncbi:MAG: hypothetical protein V2A79_01465 [Planctomycetota bacterium]